MNIKSIRPFLGSKDFDLSRRFYSEIGFEEIILDPKMSVFKMDGFAFYLQRYYAKDWVDNTMVFLELEDPEIYLEHLNTLNLSDNFKNVRISKMHHNDWGSEFFLHDPSGILWHIGKFNSLK